MTETMTAAAAAATLIATPTDHRILLAVQKQRAGLIEERDALSADLATMRRKYQAAADHITRLRAWQANDCATIAQLHEDVETAESWAQHYQEVAERKAAKARRLKKQAAALAAEVERLTTDASASRVTIASMCRELKPVFRPEFRGDNPVWACGKLRDDHQELLAQLDGLIAELSQKRENDADYAHLADEVAGRRQETALWHDLAQYHALRADKIQAEVESLTADIAYWRQATADADGKCGTLRVALDKAQADMSDLNAAWRADRTAYLRLDGAGPEYTTTDADGRVVHYGRGRIVALSATEDALDDEYYASTDEPNEATGLSNRATDAALRRLAQQEAT